MGQLWGYEVKMPADSPVSLVGHGRRQPLSAWVACGVKRADDQPLLGGGEKAAIPLPAGVRDPAFLVYRNCDAVYPYNTAESYALAIAPLSGRLRGDSGLVASWPTNDPGISRLECKQLQKALLACGCDAGGADGLTGASTRKAIQAG